MFTWEISKILLIALLDHTQPVGLEGELIIIPFVFCGMGCVFSGGNTNNIAKINNKSISTQDFINYLNSSKIDTN